MEKQKSTQLMLNFGILQGLIITVYSVILYAIDKQFEAGYISLFFSLLLSVGILVLAYKQFKNANEGFMSLGEAIKTGLGISVIAGVVSVIYQVIYQKFIDPGYLDRLLAFQKEQMIESNPDMTQEQMNMALGMAEKFSGLGFSIAIILISSLFFGLILSLIVGAIMKKDRPAHF